jgi:hypothetical protein|tara:strand:- start:850 stop:1029 length:180 start_codon:yes stop_codon:yes gene_type:complete
MSDKDKKGFNWDGKSRVVTDLYRKNFDEIFNGVLIKKSNKKDVKKIEKLIDEEVEKDDG